MPAIATCVSTHFNARAWNVHVSLLGQDHHAEVRPAPFYQQSNVFYILNGDDGDQRHKTQMARSCFQDA